MADKKSQQEMWHTQKRVLYYNNQLLTEREFKDEQEYHIYMRQLRNRILHAVGVCLGFELKLDEKGEQVKVTKGLALNGEGQELVSLKDVTLPIEPGPDGSEVAVWISYHKDPVAEPPDEENRGKATRLKEGVLFEWGPAPDEKAMKENSTKIYLGKVAWKDKKSQLRSDGRRDGGETVPGTWRVGQLQLGKLDRPDPPQLRADEVRKEVKLDGRLTLTEQLRVGQLQLGNPERPDPPQFRADEVRKEVKLDGRLTLTDKLGLGQLLLGTTGQRQQITVTLPIKDKDYTASVVVKDPAPEAKELQLKNAARRYRYPLDEMIPPKDAGELLLFPVIRSIDTKSTVKFHVTCQGGLTVDPSRKNLLTPFLMFEVFTDSDDKDWTLEVKVNVYTIPIGFE